MKRSFSLVVCLAAAIAGACTTASALGGEAEGSPEPALSSLLRERRDPPLVSAYDALQEIPGYARLLKQTTVPLFIVRLDGALIGDIEVLKRIPATDIRQMRLITETQSAANAVTVQIVVTTTARSRGSR